MSRIPRILYVEDHEDTRECVSIVLVKNNFEVVTADTFEEGLFLAQQNFYDLYLLDMCLPDGVGVELARQIRWFNRKTPIVFFSAAAFESDQLEAVRAGAQAYLIKPTAPSELCEVISTLIELDEMTMVSTVSSFIN